MNPEVLDAIAKVRDMKITEAFYEIKSQGNGPTITVLMEDGKPWSVILKVGPIDYFFQKGVEHTSDLGTKFVFAFDGWGANMMPPKSRLDS